MAEWIIVRNWDKFQHYDPAKRPPTWIKVYTELLHDDAYLDLTGHQRAVLHGLWLEYASARSQLRLDTTSLTRRLGLRVSSRTLKTLSDAGFIEISASKPLAPCYPDASPRALAREEKRRETPTESLSSSTSPTTRAAAAPAPKQAPAPARNGTDEDTIDPEGLKRIATIMSQSIDKATDDREAQMMAELASPEAEAKRQASLRLLEEERRTNE